MNGVKRMFVEKKPGFNIEANHLLNDIKMNLGLSGLSSLRILNRYDISGLTNDEYRICKETIFSERPVDFVYDEEFHYGKEDKIFGIEYLPGQYDQRADSAIQCIEILTKGNRATISTAKIIVLEGNISEKDFQKIKNYCINTVDSREASLSKPEAINENFKQPETIETICGFIESSDDCLEEFRVKNELAMSLDDLKFCRNYFENIEKRNPTITEIKVIDTYWSDHCRHTTFMTEITDVKINKGKYSQIIQKAYEEYLDSKDYVYDKSKKAICLMDLATIGMKELKKKGLLNDLDESDEKNACSIEIDAKIDGENQKWLIMFKNETHNHPTEIEPFGGAATCLGGAIRDPLSGRAYVYQAMRVTGSADPRKGIDETLQGKLPQRKITIGAANGYSSYGNQIGLATGQVAEIYDEDFVAKRMEIGAVIAAAPKKNVIRGVPEEGDVVILIGGRTGRDGCGGATGSSKEHTEESILKCGAEVQKGNAPTERKIQRLFRNPRVSKMIKRCNDFGAGGVSVAIGELADGLDINLDLIPKKYEGLDGTELAISESQERMAVVISNIDKDEFIKLAEEENLEATTVANITSERRLKMSWKGNLIVDISRDFLDTNGVRQRIGVKVESPSEDKNYFNALRAKIEENPRGIKEAWLKNLQDINVCSQKGLVERFDSTIGASTVLMPFGGKHQATPTEGMVSKLPVMEGKTDTGTIMTYGYNAQIGKWSPFHGAAYSIIEAVTKVVALGGNYSSIRLTLQEYFEKLGRDEEKWGNPFASLLGAFYTQRQLQIPAIGGKDSMSGTFKNLNVPPTLVAFAVNVLDIKKIVSSEFKKINSKVILVHSIVEENGLPDFERLKINYAKVHNLISSKKVLSSSTVRVGGIAAAVTKMSFGNRIGIKISEDISIQELCLPWYGSIILEIDESVDVNKELEGADYKLLGETWKKEIISLNNMEIEINKALKAWEIPLENIFGTKAEVNYKEIRTLEFTKVNIKTPVIKAAKPRIVIPVFPGTNCEYDTKKAFENAGGSVTMQVFKNLSSKMIEDSINNLATKIKNAEIIAIPGGFSAGDEPDGSGKFIAAVFRNEKVKEAVMEFLKVRDGLMIGICNGFQALIKLGLISYGEIRDLKEDSPTLTYNSIGRHVSCMVRTKVVSKLSPWFSNVNIGDIHTVAVSHGEGRFVASNEMIEQLIKNGQVATQYVDFEGNATYDNMFNPNGSFYAVEGLTSPDGRILGKMAHSERIGDYVSINVPGEKDQKIFKSGIDYFK